MSSGKLKTPGIRVTRKDFSAFYAILYRQIEQHLNKSSIKTRASATWDRWKSNGLRQQMNKYATVSKIMNGTNIPLTNLLQLLNNHFAFLKSYIKYSEDPIDPNIIYYQLTTKGNTVES